MMRALERYRRDAHPDEPQTPRYTEAHLRVVDFIDELISTMLSTNSALSPVVKMMARMKPAILADLSKIPEAELQAFMVDLGSRMIEAGTPWPANLIEIEGE